jgi:hypothetical protein
LVVIARLDRIGAKITIAYFGRGVVWAARASVAAAPTSIAGGGSGKVAE